MGIDPSPLTLRQVLTMYEGHSKDRWWHTSSLMALVHNTQCTKQGDCLAPADFNPHLAAKKQEAKSKVDAEVAEVIKRIRRKKGRHGTG